MNVINDIWNEIKNHDTIICLAHINPDGDAYASQIGLSLIIKQAFPNKKVFCYNDSSVRFKEWNNYLESETPDNFANSLVIITDCAVKERINSKYYHLAKTIIKIDHHPKTDLYGKFNWIDEHASSASQMIAELVCNLQIKINQEIAEILYLGIVSDTDRFHYSVVNAHTFQVLGFLTSYNISFSQIYDKYYQQTLDSLKLKAHILQQYQITKNKVIFCKNDNKILNDFNISAFQANEQVDLLANIDHGLIWMLFSQQSENSIIGIFRSNKFPVNNIAAQFGGGGHYHYAGGNFKSWKQVNEIIKSFDKLVEETK